MEVAQKRKDILLLNILDRVTKVLKGLTNKIFKIELEITKIKKTLADQTADISGIARLDGRSSSLNRRSSSSSSCSCSISNCDQEDDDDDDSIIFIDDDATADAAAATATPNDLLDKNINNDSS